MKINVVFDGNYLFHKSFGVFATYYKGVDMLNVLAEKKNRDVLIRKCVIDMCYALNQLNNVEIERVAFVIDSHSWRHSIYDDYKYRKTAVREPWYDYFIMALSEFEVLLRKRGIIVTRVDGAEGDDMLYVWSNIDAMLDGEIGNVLIITADSDIRQLINDNVFIFCNNSKNLNVYCTEYNVTVAESMFNADIRIVAVNPQHIIIRKIILGDSSDNIPKIWKGIGEKSVDKLFEQRGGDLCVYGIGDLKDVAEHITRIFVDYYSPKYPEMKHEDIKERIVFNLRMCWLDVWTYLNEGLDKLFESMVKEVLNSIGKYKYKKTFTLEQFYGMPIK